MKTAPERLKDLLARAKAELGRSLGAAGVRQSAIDELEEALEQLSEEERADLLDGRKRRARPEAEGAEGSLATLKNGKGQEDGEEEGDGV